MRGEINLCEIGTDTMETDKMHSRMVLMFLMTLTVISFQIYLPCRAHSEAITFHTCIVVQRLVML